MEQLIDTINAAAFTVQGLGFLTVMFCALHYNREALFLCTGLGCFMSAVLAWQSIVGFYRPPAALTVLMLAYAGCHFLVILRIDGILESMRKANLQHLNKGEAAHG